MEFPLGRRNLSILSHSLDVVHPEPLYRTSELLESGLLLILNDPLPVMESIGNTEVVTQMNADTSMSKPKQIVCLAVSLLIVFGVASVGGFLTNLSVETWYPSLAKPSWTPSGVTIGTVWTVLYTLMAIAAWIVWRRSAAGVRQIPLALYAIQLLLNLGWSALFFGLRSPGLALVEICVLWVAILATAAMFWRVSKSAGALMAPYLIWVSFAGILNAMIWRLN